MQTSDEKNLLQPIRPFPGHWEYAHAVIDTLWAALYNVNGTPDDPQATVVICDKSRQMMVTWIALLFFDWCCRFMPAREFLVVKNTQEESDRLIAEKIRPTHERLPAWVKRHSPITSSPPRRVIYLNTGSKVIAGTENVAERAARGGTCTGALLDEAARHTQLRSTVSSMVPMLRMVVAVSTAKHGTPSAGEFVAMLGRKDLGPITPYHLTHKEG